MTNVWPNGSLTMPTVTAEFGLYDPFGTGTYRHNGIDLIGFDAMHSPVTGVVTFAGYNGTAGNEVRIREDGTGDVIRLLHNRALNVRSGQRVDQGDTVAWMGDTGKVTGPHCHLEIHPGGGSPIDPRTWYAQRNISSAGFKVTTISKEWDEMATKDEIKDAVFEVLASRPDAVIISYSGEGRNGIYLAAPGYWHQFTAEQWKQFQDHGMRSAIRELTPVNDRDFDVFKEIYTVNQGMVSSITEAQLASIAKSVQDSLKNLSVDTEVDDETIEKIANAAIDKLVARAKE